MLEVLALLLQVNCDCLSFTFRLTESHAKLYYYYYHYLTCDYSICWRKRCQWRTKLRRMAHNATTTRIVARSRKTRLCFITLVSQLREPIGIETFDLQIRVWLCCGARICGTIWDNFAHVATMFEDSCVELPVYFKLYRLQASSWLAQYFQKTFFSTYFRSVSFTEHFYLFLHNCLSI